MENDTGVRTSGFFHTKIPHWRLVRDNDVAFKQLVFMVRKLRIGALKDIQQNAYIHDQILHAGNRFVGVLMGET